MDGGQRGSSLLGCNFGAYLSAIPVYPLFLSVRCFSRGLSSIRGLGAGVDF